MVNDELAPGRNFLAAGGEMGALMRAHDWSASALGSPATWPQRLRSIVNVVLTSRFAMWMGWGPELTFFYNDAYAPTLGIKHGWALGRPSREVWSEIWADIGPRIAHVLETGQATWDEGLLLFLERSGYSEDMHTFSYSPLLDDDETIAGHLCVVTEETERCIGDRRLHTLRDLAARLTEAGEEGPVLAAVQEALAGNARDLPCSLLYLWDEDGGLLTLAASTGFADPSEAIARFGAAAQSQVWQPQALWSGAPRLEIDWPQGALPLPCGAWAIPPRRALVLPVARPGQDRPAGLLVVGLSPHRHLDAAYVDFLGLIAGQIASGLGNARAYAEERRRAAALAELDRAKTDFFSNVSHEFRTPLTLLLNPIEELRARRPEFEPDLLDVAHRNALRLLKLVNALLDFSRLEAGRAQASYEPTDLAAFTADLASTFRSVIEQAGLALLVEAPALPQPVHVDRDMWEKVVLNLLSNAFKFTLSGTIAVRVGVTADGGAAMVAVADTGSGIPAEDLPHLFERFHRAAGARGRSIEGSGIGLALVRELVHLHGGAVAVASEPGRGSTFSVSVPFGTRHLPAEAVQDATDGAASARKAGSFVAEARRWLPDAAARQSDEPAPPPDSGVPAGRSGRILLADDNADMRGYLERLLRDSGFSVQAVADGRAALAAVRTAPPDLLLSDVMMPGLDGFGLLAALRADPATRALPVVLLSARAGEGARVEAMQAGADGYLVKPFNARELVATLDGHVRLQQQRRRNQDRIAGQKRILEHIATGQPLADVLDGIARYVEAQEPGAVATFLLAAPDGRHFARSFGPSLPHTFHTEIGQLPIGPPFLGSCAQAVRGCAPVAVPDIAADATFAPAWRSLALRHGLQAVRSNPVLLAEGSAAASLAIWWRTARDPTPADPTLIDVATHLASIALERDRNERALRDLTLGLEQRVDQALAERKVLADVFEATDAFVLVLDHAYMILAVNRAAAAETERLLGVRPLPGMSFLDLLAGQPEHRAAIQSKWGRALAGEEFTAVVPFDDAARGRRQYEIKFNTLRDSGGRAIGAYQLGYDVTERIQGQAMLAEAQAQLHEMQKLETIGQLTGGIAHDFNNLLTPIFGALDRLQTRYGSDERTGRMIGGAMQSAERARVLVGRLLSFARRQHLEARPVPVAELVRGMAELIDRSLGPQIAITLDLPDSLPPARVDPNQLELALLNLCINARDAMPGGDTVRVVAAEVMVAQDAANAASADLAPGSYVQLSVTDTGTGMDHETLRRAVEPFYTTKGVGKGTGLGLSMAHGLAAQSGGVLRLRSAPGRGTTATMLLPIAADAPAEALAAALPGSGPARRLVILLVDDEDLVRMAMSDMLAGMGHQVIEAGSPAAALRLLQTHAEIELIVTDQMMPNMSGVALAREARRLRPGLPALLVTGFATLDDAEAGHLPRISKPFREPGLAAMIAEAVAAPRIVPLRPVATEGRA